jgi:hypothetical protein
MKTTQKFIAAGVIAAATFVSAGVLQAVDFSSCSELAEACYGINGTPYIYPETCENGACYLFCSGDPSGQYSDWCYEG